MYFCPTLRIWWNLWPTSVVHPLPPDRAPRRHQSYNSQIMYLYHPLVLFGKFWCKGPSNAEFKLRRSWVSTGNHLSFFIFVKTKLFRSMIQLKISMITMMMMVTMTMMTTTKMKWWDERNEVCMEGRSWRWQLPIRATKTPLERVGKNGEKCLNVKSNPDFCHFYSHSFWGLKISHKNVNLRQKVPRKTL